MFSKYRKHKRDKKDKKSKDGMVESSSDLTSAHTISSENLKEKDKYNNNSITSASSSAPTAEVQKYLSSPSVNSEPMVGGYPRIQGSNPNLASTPQTTNYPSGSGSGSGVNPNTNTGSSPGHANVPSNGTHDSTSSTRSPLANMLPSPSVSNRSTNTPWSRLRVAKTPFPRYRHAACNLAATDGELYMIGGLQDGSVYGDTWSIDVNRGTAELIESYEGVPAPRVGHSCVLLGNAFIGMFSIHVL